MKIHILEGKLHTWVTIKSGWDQRFEIKFISWMYMDNWPPQYDC